MNEFEILEDAANMLQPIPESVQYFHDFKGRKTYAVDVGFDKQDLLEVINNPFQQVTFAVGISFVHPNDVYTKKIGRKVSARKLLPLKFEFLRLETFSDNKAILLFADDSGIFIKFRVCKDSDRPHLLGVFDDYYDVILDKKY